MSALKITIKGTKALNKVITKEIGRQEKALQTAVKVEGFSLLKTLKTEIRAGNPGGRQFKGLSYLARAWGAIRLRPDKPLKKLANNARYQVHYNPFKVEVGFVGPRVSASWKKIATIQQEGFTGSMSEQVESYFRKKGATMSKRAIAKKYMFLDADTRRFRTPARPVIDPFWRRRERKAWRNIQKNYRLKMLGKRI